MAEGGRAIGDGDGIGVSRRCDNNLMVESNLGKIEIVTVERIEEVLHAVLRGESGRRSRGQ